MKISCTFRNRVANVNSDKLAFEMVPGIMITTNPCENTLSGMNLPRNAENLYREYLERPPETGEE